MENQNQNQPEPQPIPQQIVNQPDAKKDIARDIKNFITQTYVSFKKKKIFMVLVILFGIIILIIITGTIYRLSKSSNQKPIATNSPKPVPTQEIVFTEESKKSKSVIETLREKIQKIDISQRYLTPPNIDFKVDF